MNTLLDKLPDINFAEKDPAVIEAEVISFFEEALNKKLYDGDTVRLLLLAFSKYLSLIRANIDYAGKQNLLRYAAEGFIENIGALVGVTGAEAEKAVTELTFTLSAPLSNAAIIEAGTRATKGDRVYFATKTAAEIPAGELSVTVLAECTEAGIVGNGYQPGEINRLADPFSYSYSVYNTSVTQGGADIEDIERYRERIRQAPESFAAGAKGAYAFWAKTVSSLIVDVSVASPGPGVVEIIPLLSNGEIPSDSLLEDIYSVCADDTRRGFTDLVIVRAPEVVSYSAYCRYYISRSDAAISATIYNRVLAAVSEYELWQKSVLGRDINPSKLIELVMRAGVKRVEVNLDFQSLLYYQIAVTEGVLVEYGGMEDD